MMAQHVSRGGIRMPLRTRLSARYSDSFSSDVLTALDTERKAMWFGIEYRLSDVLGIREFIGYPWHLLFILPVIYSSAIDDSRHKTFHAELCNFNAVSPAPLNPGHPNSKPLMMFLFTCFNLQCFNYTMFYTIYSWHFTAPFSPQEVRPSQHSEEGTSHASVPSI